MQNRRRILDRNYLLCSILSVQTIGKRTISGCRLKGDRLTAREDDSIFGTIFLSSRNAAKHWEALITQFSYLIKQQMAYDAPLTCCAVD